MGRICAHSASFYVGSVLEFEDWDFGFNYRKRERCINLKKVEVNMAGEQRKERSDKKKAIAPYISVTRHFIRL